ncbi:hypothetical protein [Streptomyces rubiginosohelvolus]
MTDTTPTPADRPADQLRAAAVWVDGDPLMEAMAAAVYEQCDKHPEVSVTIDDPRTIAAVAATVARQLLGTSAAADGNESCGRFVPDTPRAPGLCASCGDAKGWHSLLATAEPAAPAAPEETQ